MNSVRIGFVGVGSMGQCAHLANYVNQPGCEVVALAEVREDVGRTVAARYGVPRVYPDHAAMLAAEELDGIVASQPFCRHGQLVPELYAAGVPLLTEKPLAASIEQGEKILRALQSSGAWHMVGYHKRCDPATIYAKAEIDRLKQSGELGAMRYIRLTMPSGDWIAGGFANLITSDAPAPALPNDPRPADMDEATYNAYVGFVNYYIHQVNLLRHLLGEPYRLTHADHAGRLIVAESDSGVTGIIEMEPYVTTRDWQESALVSFDRGYVKLDLPAPLACHRPGRVELLRDPAPHTDPITLVPTLPWVGAMEQQARTFIAAIRGEAAVPCDAAEALEDLRIAREYLRLKAQCSVVSA
jgi:predicted dehydrogenase